MKLTLRNLLAFIYAIILIALGFVTRAKRKALEGEYILSLYFHSPSKKLFEGIIKWFLKNGFHFISVKDIELIMKGNKPFPRGAVILTIDDGWLSNEENVVAIANKYEIPVTIFVSTEPVENGSFWWSYVDIARRQKLTVYKPEHLKKLSNDERLKIVKVLMGNVHLRRQAMTVEQIKRIAVSKYVTIGGHTVTHPILINCEDDESFNEIKDSKRELEDWLQTEVNVFAYPNGDFSLREVNYLHQLNFKLGFTTEETYLTKEKIGFNYHLPRFYIYEDATLAENICRMTGVWGKAKF